MGRSTIWLEVVEMMEKVGFSILFQMMSKLTRWSKIWFFFFFLVLEILGICIFLRGVCIWSEVWKVYAFYASATPQQRRFKLLMCCIFLECLEAFLEHLTLRQALRAPEKRLLKHWFFQHMRRFLFD